MKVALVGVDGATFDVIDPLAAEGRLPNLARLMEEGARAPLRSLPKAVSPAVWTTIATGRLPPEHGIRGFQRDPRDRRNPELVSVADRRVPALWNVAGAFGRTAGVIGWWVTWPAEPVRGFVVSDRVAYSRFQTWNDGKKRARLTHPPELLEEIEPLVVDPRDPPLSELRRLADLTPEEVETLRAVERPVLFHGLSVFNAGWCEQRTYERIAFHLLERGQPDLLLLLLIAVDPVSHTFWHYYEPGAFEGAVDPAKAERLGRVIPNVYVHGDRTIGRLRSALDPDTVLFVLSDHGFGPSGRLPEPSRWVRPRAGRVERVRRPLNVGQSGSHRRDGVLIAAGGPIRPGVAPREPPTVADVAPTVLALLGLPVARDLPGRVLEEWIEPEFLREHPVRTVESYEGRIDPPEVRDVRDGLDAERLDYLRALGYIDE